MTKYASVAISGPPKKSFIYQIPENINKIIPGQRLLVPFGSSQKVGFYLETVNLIKGIKIKKISRLIDKNSYFSDELFNFCIWMADYYFANPADCLISALPPLLKKNRSPKYFWSSQSLPSVADSIKHLYRPGSKISKSTIEKINAINNELLSKLVDENIITEQWFDEANSEKRKIIGFKISSLDKWQKYFKTKKFQPAPFDNIRNKIELKSAGWSDYQIKKSIKENILMPVYSSEPGLTLDFIKPINDLHNIKLNTEQKKVFDIVKKRLTAGFNTFLLQGVTGSGKTIVYCHICKEVIKLQKTALVLTPEIALTSNALAYFRGFFGNCITVIHSAMTEKERLESWRGIRSGQFQVVVGPRSAIFAPLPNLGIIIVDEEHDSSYKQNDPAPRFHGRDSAVMRAKINNIPVLLGSASPSLESYYQAMKGKYQLLKLTQRPGQATLPTVRIVDMKKDRLRGELPFFSFQLKKEVDIRLEKNEQVILFLNRRGHSPQLKCAKCGYVPQCPNCCVKLTFHKTDKKLSCHYCGFLSVEYHNCPNCQNRDFLFMGVGTQKVEEHIPRLFKGALPIRLDSDTASGRKRAYNILSDFSQKKSNLLLGTQMVTKGLDLPDVTLVGVLSADMSLDLPDFRASEKTFAQLLQVAGRSGRSHTKGEVIIQTYYPDHNVINDAARQDYHTFYEQEITSRKNLSYPPFSRIVKFVLSSTNDNNLAKEALSFRKQLHHRIEKSDIKVQLLGPAPCPLYYLRGKYRRHLFVKTRKVVKLVRLLTDWEKMIPRFKLPSSIKLNIDVDPNDMM